ncbi:MAG TPA: hypothetical protein VJ841_02605 [Candidatus Saccharimonadales bacterium]|nr:hypothetical protein [Candidatus Saccharimonadales bacterium]
MKTKLFTLLVVAVQLLDLIVHGSVGQLEPLRVAANIVMVVAALIPLFLRHASGVLTVVVGLIVYLILNTMFIVNDGIYNNGSLRVGLVAFVLATVAAALFFCRVLQQAGAGKRPY